MSEREWDDKNNLYSWGLFLCLYDTHHLYTLNCTVCVYQFNSELCLMSLQGICVSTGFTLWQLLSVLTSTIDKKTLWTRTVQVSHIFQVRLSYWDRHINWQWTGLHLYLWMYFFFWKQTLIRLTPPLMVTTTMLLPRWQTLRPSRSTVGIQHSSIWANTCRCCSAGPWRAFVSHNQSTGRFCHTPSPRVRSCWAPWIRWTTGSGGGNQGAGKSSKFLRCA